ncbi:GNAT family N-acetyltransferase [Hymenobacter sp. BT635]|uniref:GNAT family N-acetyltransferase n=1 Tax=Hymenobacter nitidus TaxID=2880929 RepID=A0ABS8AL75_9BACT|nr:GNAT family N-acetyltransferase [Hymenobacter nitidus]MCB2379734.1 GNAT family N-acetyltransferase [Hymenobacter nitidus]
MPAIGSITHLEWDSAFLGFPTGQLYASGMATEALRALLAQAQKEGYKLLYWFVRPDDAASLAAARAVGITPADDKHTYARALPPLLPSPLAPVQRAAPTDAPELLSLALQSGAYSRFRLDPLFGPAVFEQLYAQWLQNALNNDKVLVCRQPGTEGAALGLLTLEKQAAELTIGLLAVDSRWRQQGIGQALLAAAYQEAQAAGYTALRVTTQGANPVACRFYERAGFALIERQLVFHLWLTPPQ